MPYTIAEILLMLSSEDIEEILIACGFIRDYPTGDEAVIDKLTSMTLDNRVVMTILPPLGFFYGHLKWEAGFALTSERFNEKNMVDENIPLVRLERTYEPMKGMKALELMLAHPEIEDPYDTEERFRILYEKGFIKICDYEISPSGKSVRKVKDSCIGG